MSKLPKAQARQISELINTVQCAFFMLEDCTSEDRAMWRLDKAQAFVTLADNFGIELPSIGYSRELVARSKD